MWLSHEDARSDFILAVAATVLGRFAVGLIRRLPFYPVATTAGLVLDLVWLVAITGLTPYLLARYRDDVPGAFGLDPKTRGPVLPALVVAAPLLLASMVPIVLDGELDSILLGLLGRFTLGQPGLGASLLTVDQLLVVIEVLIVAVGGAMLATFLVVRARDSFRSPDMDLTEALRTFGMVGIAATLLLGLLRAATGFGLGNAVLIPAALLIVLLLIDQYVPPRLTTTRAAVLGPTIAILVLYVLAAGGLFRGNLLLGLHQGAAAGVIMVCAAALIESRHGWGAALLVGAAAVYPVGDIVVSPLPGL